MPDPLIYARAVHFAATLAVAGVVFFVVAVAEPALAKAKRDSGLAASLRNALRWIGWIGLAVAVASGAAWLVFIAAAMSGRPPAEVFAQDVLPTVLLQTDFGRDWLTRLGFAGVLAAVLVPLLAQKRRPSLRIKTIAAVAAAALTGSLAWAGHAIGGQGAEGFVHPTADALHLIAAAAWVGALVPLALLLRLAAPSEDSLAVARTATLRFSTLGVGSVATLLITGVVNSWYLVGDIEALLDTAYGRLLLAKVAVFLVMVAIAACNRLRLTPRITGETALADVRTALRQLQRNAVIEAAAGAVVIGFVAVLGTLPPAAHAGHHHPTYTSVVPADAAFVHIHSDQGMAEVTIEPGRTGTARATIRLWNEDLEPLEAQRLTLALAPPSAPNSPIRRAAVEDADQGWQVDGLALGEPGNWMVTVNATLASGKHLVLQAPIVIEAGR